ncbi:hypothetical protein C8N29_1249 [Agitococcus lubricus]|uniref:Uncharacterized protein n=1 Tax=Agitococcus lubricus TaxID=1077255 RepID=A0A2T5IT90_9GAMM|nr:hypothetical protein C8N29_1249 [Agitococcus lubricus]
MNHLYLLCKKYLVSYQEYIDRLDDANDIPIKRQEF